jgi:hypothetical protein
MKAGRRTIFASLVCSAPLAVSAASLPIEGEYGNKAGCLFAKTGESTGEEDFILLTPKEIRSAVSLCEIKSIDKTAGNKIGVTLSCADEGEAGNIPLHADVIRAGGKNIYRVDFSDGTSWGPFKKCR